MGKLFRRLMQAFYFVGTFLVTFAAIFAGLGYAVPLFDALNHLQPLWFSTTLVALLLAGVFFHNGIARAFALTLSATGFLASAMIVVPEALEGLALHPPAKPGTQTFRLLTYNVFGLNYDMARVAQMIDKESPDILTLQEFFPGQRRGLHPLLVGKYPYFVVCDHDTKRGNVALYARMPFSFPSGESCMNDPRYGTSAVLARFVPQNGPAFSVMTTHLDWPVQISKLRGSTSFLDGLRRMYQRKGDEYAQLSAYLDDASGPLILAGDFNSTSWSYSLRVFAVHNRLHRETHALFTYPQRFAIDGWRDVPAFLPLDQVMTRDGVVVHGLRAGDPAGSDHKPVIVDFSVSAAQP